MVWVLEKFLSLPPAVASTPAANVVAQLLTLMMTMTTPHLKGGLKLTMTTNNTHFLQHHERPLDEDGEKEQCVY